jgi:hypothetical protein
MGAERPKGYVAFAGTERIATGDLWAVAVAAHSVTHDQRASIRIFAEESGEVVEVDLRGTADDVLTRVTGRTDAADAELEGTGRGPGRPKLGVVSKEVTLLPRHWAWLGAQRGSVSATLRRLIDEARHLHEARDAVRRAQDSAYRFMSVMASGEPTFDEAIRALYRGDHARFEVESAAWPPDIRDQSRKLAAAAFLRTTDLPAPPTPEHR